MIVGGVSRYGDQAEVSMDSAHYVCLRVQSGNLSAVMPLDADLIDRLLTILSYARDAQASLLKMDRTLHGDAR